MGKGTEVADSITGSTLLVALTSLVSKVLWQIDITAPSGIGSSSSNTHMHRRVSPTAHIAATITTMIQTVVVIDTTGKVVLKRRRTTIVLRDRRRTTASHRQT